MSLSRFVRSSRGFVTLWLGQLISGFGSGMTGFVLGVWVYERTHRITAFGLALLSSTLPAVLALPVAGALVDRWSRRGALLAAASVSAATVAALAGLLAADRLTPVVLYAALAVNAAAHALQMTAMSAVTPQLVGAPDLARASGMMHGAMASAQIGAPLAAGVVLAAAGPVAVLWLDCASFGAVIAAVLAIRFPALPARTTAGAARRGAAVGWRYLAGERGLIALLALFAAINVVDSVFQAVLTPLGVTEAGATGLSRTLAIGGVGMLAGTLALGVWGGPRRLVLGTIWFSALAGVTLIAAGALRSATGLAAALAVNCFALPLINGCSQAIWQRKVPAELQGRVFAVRGMVAWSLNPLAFVVAGPLVERVFEPLVASGGGAGSLASWLGDAPGRGMGLLLICAGLAAIALALAALWNRPLRALEAELAWEAAC